MLVCADADSSSGDSSEDIMEDTSSVTLYFEPSSEAGERRCAYFESVNDTITEADEVMNFNASTGNNLDVFADGNMFSVTIVDNDGTAA